MTDVKPVLLVAACALRDADGRVMLAQRPAGKALAGKWEFPGGKVEAGETPEQTIVRELREELGIEPCESCLQPFAFASHPYEAFHLVMPLFICRRWDGFISPQEGQKIAWTMPARLLDFDLAPADRPLAAEIRDRL
ncbi:(deoxy)nucleoside triphosphate pyrophosphohydrolase [Hyphobacterium indicum]|jgi:8-oxo-dGTP diphosphatase|uniref:(deoxy)nucleoside triphosphate pyrophosphohydrolase n=1 Tax=Hyphobacterium indicum TaxID=2162714 RepID=UPI000D65A836|nr:(deoxy)nucleoside triphosphate pyrophosphohydrolase [Hyphobacterium indicum]